MVEKEHRALIMEYGVWRTGSEAWSNNRGGWNTECGGKECRVLAEYGVRGIRDGEWNIKNGVWIAELC